LIAAEYVGVEIEVVPVEMGKTNKTPEFLALNPWGKVPTLETDAGEGIWESNAIARYVARLSDDNNLFGSTPIEYGQVEQWIDWVRGELELAGSVWLYPIYGLIPNCQEATCKAKEDIKRLMCGLNSYLENRNYFVGENITLADIVIACSLVPLYTKVFDPEYRADFPNVTKWFQNVIDQPNFKKVQGDVFLCETMAVAGQPAEQPAEPAAEPVELVEEPAEPEVAVSGQKSEEEIADPVEPSGADSEEVPVGGDANEPSNEAGDDSNSAKTGEDNESQ